MVNGRVSSIAQKYDERQISQRRKIRRTADFVAPYINRMNHSFCSGERIYRMKISL